MIDARTVAHYLLERGLLGPAEVVGGGLLAYEASRRNRNVKVVLDGGAGLFVKQASEHEPSTRATVGREAAFLEAVGRNAAGPELAAVVPRFVGNDPARAVLVLDLLPGATSLQERLPAGAAFPPAWACLVGTALGTCHRVGRGARSAFASGVLPEQLPWILTATGLPTDGSLPGVSGGGHRLLAALRQFPDFAGPFASLAGAWRRETLIHGDLKWDNCLLSAAGDRLLLVDWELVDWGDAAWDVGSVLQAFLLQWLYGLAPQTAGDPRAVAALEPLRPAIRAFWDAYRTADGAATDTDLERAVAYGAARLVHSTYEHLQFSAGLTPLAVHALQLAAHLLAAPGRALPELFGL